MSNLTTTRDTVREYDTARDLAYRVLDAPVNKPFANGEFVNDMRTGYYRIEADIDYVGGDTMYAPTYCVIYSDYVTGDDNVLFLTRKVGNARTFILSRAA